MFSNSELSRPLAPPGCARPPRGCSGSVPNRQAAEQTAHTTAVRACGRDCLRSLYSNRRTAQSNLL